MHSKAVALIRNLLTCHDIDPRYSAQEQRARVANLDLPIVGIVLDAVGCLHGAAELAAFAASSREEANTPVIDQVNTFFATICIILHSVCGEFLCHLLIDTGT